MTWQNLVDKSKPVSPEDYIVYRRWAAYNADPEKYGDPRNPTKENDALIFGTIDDQTGYNNVMAVGLAVLGTRALSTTTTGWATLSRLALSTSTLSPLPAVLIR